MENLYKRVSLVDRVFEKLEEDILQGRYARGETVTELRLTKELGVSRTPIHDALLRLEQERLVEDNGRGYTIKGITWEDLQDIMDIRLNVEGLATYYAAQNRTPEELRELQNIVELQEFYTAKKDADHIMAQDDQFHAALCRICRHHVISDTLVPLHRKIQRYRRASIANENRMQVMVTEHRAIFDAVAAGDAEAARQLTVQHVQNAKNSMPHTREN